MSIDEKCPYCGLHPFEYVDIGVGSQAIAVNCCEWGELLYTGEYTREEIDEMIEEQERLEVLWDGLADAASY